MRIMHEVVKNKGSLFTIRSTLHGNETFPKEAYNKFAYTITKGTEMTIKIRVASKDYGIQFQENKKEVEFEDLRNPPPWAANWLTVSIKF
jgi:hypothetical protein